MLVQIIEYICTFFWKIIFHCNFSNLFRLLWIVSQITLVYRKIINRNALVLLIIISHIKHFEISNGSKRILFLIWVVQNGFILSEIIVNKGWLIISIAAFTFLKGLTKSIFKAFLFALLTQIRANRRVRIIFLRW